MLKLYQIAIDHTLEFETRYAALKLMKEINRKRNRLSENQLKVYKAALIYRREQLPQVLNMDNHSISKYLFRLKTKGYERFDKRLV